MTCDVHWNIAMERLAESFCQNCPTPMSTVFCTFRAAIVHKDQVLLTKVGQKTRQRSMPQCTAPCICPREGTVGVFKSIDWLAFEHGLNKLNVHKHINVTKYIFNWQNNGRQNKYLKTAEQHMRTERLVMFGSVQWDADRTKIPNTIYNVLSSMMLEQLIEASVNCRNNGWRRFPHTLRLRSYFVLTSNIGPSTTTQKRSGNWMMDHTDTNLRKPLMNKIRSGGVMFSKVGSAPSGVTSKWTITLKSTRMQTFQNTSLWHGRQASSCVRWFTWAFMRGSTGMISYMIGKPQREEWLHNRMQLKQWWVGIAKRPVSTHGPDPFYKDFLGQMYRHYSPNQTLDLENYRSP